MIFEVFAIYDSAVEHYSAPFFKQTVAEAVREFVRLVCDKGSRVWHAPKDFHLFHLGSYDDSKGTFENKLAPASIGSGFDWLHSKQAKEYCAHTGIESPPNPSQMVRMGEGEVAQVPPKQVD